MDVVCRGVHVKVVQIKLSVSAAAFKLNCAGNQIDNTFFRTEQLTKVSTAAAAFNLREIDSVSYLINWIS